MSFPLCYASGGIYYRKKYDAMARRKYEELLHRGRAGTLNNLVEFYHSTDITC